MTPKERLEAIRSRARRGSVDRGALTQKAKEKREQLRSKRSSVDRGAMTEALEAKREQLRSKRGSVDRGAMTEALRTKREQLQLQLEERRQTSKSSKGKEEDNPRRKWWLLLLLLLLLLALIRDCRCNDVPAPPPPQDTGVSEPVPTVPVEPPPPTPTGRLERRDRPGYATETPAPLPWIASFRMQVAARGPRLAECFVGAQRPGTLKWTTAVEAKHGLVSDHTLEPTLLSEELSKKQRECIVDVLSDPPYRLQTSDERSTPARVGMVIEF